MEDDHLIDDLSPLVSRTYGAISPPQTTAVSPCPTVRTTSHFPAYPIPPDAAKISSVIDNVCRDPVYSSSEESVTHSAVSLPELPGGSSTEDHIMDDPSLPVSCSGRSPMLPSQTTSISFGSSVDGPEEQRRLRISLFTSSDAENSLPRQPTVANNNVSFVPHESAIRHFSVTDSESPSVSSPSASFSSTTPSENVQHVPFQSHERKHRSHRQQRKHNFQGYQMRQALKKRQQSQDKSSSGSGFSAVDMTLQGDRNHAHRPNYQSYSQDCDYRSPQRPSYRRMM